jgi:hypothetical protein
MGVASEPGGEPSASRRSFASGYGLDGPGAMPRAYAPNPQDHGNPWLSPLLAASFAGLPPAPP